MDYIRFYTRGYYKGSMKPTEFSEQYFELSNWIRSGNYIKFRDLLVNDPDSIHRIYS